MITRDVGREIQWVQSTYFNRKVYTHSFSYISYISSVKMSVIANSLSGIRTFSGVETRTLTTFKKGTPNTYLLSKISIYIHFHRFLRRFCKNECYQTPCLEFKPSKTFGIPISTTFKKVGTIMK